MSLSLPRGRALVLFVLVALAGTIAGVSAGMALRPGDWTALALLIALAAAMERQGAQLFTASRASVSAAALMAAVILFGAAAALPLGLAIGIAAWLLRSRPLSRLIFNSSLMILSGGAAGLVYHAVVLALPAHDVSLVLAALAMGLVMWVANATLVAAMVSLTGGEPFQRVIRENFLWVAGHFAVMALVALGLALAWTALGFLGFAAFVTPVGVLGFALRQGSARARGAVLDAQTAESMIQEYERLLAEVEATSEEVAEFIALRRSQFPAAA